MLSSLLFPYDEDAGKLMDGWLEELAREKCILRYQVDGASYLEICNWLKHQRIEKPTESKLPASPTIPRSLTDNSRTDVEVEVDMEVDREGKGGEPEETPADLHPLNYAARILEELGLPDTFGNKEPVVANLRMRIKSGCSPGAAYEQLLAAAKDAVDEGTEITKFWFEDAGRSHGAKRSDSKATKRPREIKRNVIDGITADAGDRAERDGTERESSTRKRIGAGV